MLAHSRPLPLTVDHLYYINTPEDREGVLLTLKHRDRVRRFRFQVLAPLSLEELIAAIDREFPMLEYLYNQACVPVVSKLVSSLEILRPKPTPSRAV